jgi:hypothetical protein
MGEEGDLLLAGLDDARMRVADVETADAAREVNEGIPVDVGDERPAGLGDNNRKVSRERLADDPFHALEDLPTPRPWNLRSYVDRTAPRHGVSG